MPTPTYIAQVLAFDPKPLLAALLAKGKIQPFKRRQSIVVDDVLPVQPAGLCRCGCGVKIELPRRKWATNSCSNFGYLVQGIILGDLKEIGKLLVRLHGYGCAHCGCRNEPMEIDHILAVGLGGGGRWLDNYQQLCHNCHQEKSKIDKRLMRELKTKKVTV